LSHAVKRPLLLSNRLAAPQAIPPAMNVAEKNFASFACSFRANRSAAEGGALMDHLTELLASGFEA